MKTGEDERDAGGARPERPGSGEAGILGWGVHLPHWRLDRTTIAAVARTGGGRGTRAVASFDEDATTMAVAAGRAALASAPAAPASLWFATVAPPYLDKTNATAIHAALRLDRTVPAYDAVGSTRSAVGIVRTALALATAGAGPVLAVAADLRTGRPGSADESVGGDGAAALLVGSSAEGPVLAELVAGGSATEELLDRWRTPGDPTSKVWEERFGETRYVALATDAWNDALKAAGLRGPNAEGGMSAAQVDRVIVTGSHERGAASVAKALGLTPDPVVAEVAAAVGNTGAAHPALLLAAVLEDAGPGETIAQIVLADGAEVLLWRTTEALAAYRAGRTHPVVAVRDQLAGGTLAYGTYLAWRGFLPVEPPRRPEPARPSASAARRSDAWKYGFVGSERDDGSVHLPPSRLDQHARPMADAVGTIVTFTVDHLAYSPNPPVVFAVVDFDGGGRLPVELTDVEAGEVAIGQRVEMTFRRLFTADGIHNYFWKGRPLQRDRTGGD
jgi:hydroxymethylglutaryl-CoA synthase